VQRKAAAAALHPNTRSNGPTGERLTEPFGADRDADRVNHAAVAVSVGRATIVATAVVGSIFGAGNSSLKL
jgi:hypothetical protein